MIGKKYTKCDALEQLEYAIQRINGLFSDNENNRNRMNPEHEPNYLKLPSICLEIVLDNPFIFDLIKSETFDWETNDRIYTTNMKKSSESSDPALGILSGILNYQILIN